MSHEKNLVTFHYTSCFIGILIMVYEIVPTKLPYITWTTRGPFFHCSHRILQVLGLSRGIHRLQPYHAALTYHGIQDLRHHGWVGVGWLGLVSSIYEKKFRLSTFQPWIPCPRHPNTSWDGCFRYVLGVQILSQEVFGCLGMIHCNFSSFPKSKKEKKLTIQVWFVKSGRFWRHLWNPTDLCCWRLTGWPSILWLHPVRELHLHVSGIICISYHPGIYCTRFGSWEGRPPARSGYKNFHPCSARERETGDRARWGANLVNRTLTVAYALAFIWWWYLESRETIESKNTTTSKDKFLLSSCCSLKAAFKLWQMFLVQGFQNMGHLGSRSVTFQGTNISHRGKIKSIFKHALGKGFVSSREGIG